jgi:hypothetical protein
MFPGNAGPIPLSPQFAIPFREVLADYIYYTSTYAMPLRLDAPADAEGELTVAIRLDSKDHGGVAPSFQVGVMGYLVDL